MKATGIVRRIDDLGRVVIPKEIRRTMRIREGDALEIYTSAEGEVIFKKYSPMGELNQFASQYAEALSKTGELPVIVCDKDHVIAAAGMPKKEIIERRVSPVLEETMLKRKIISCKDANSETIRPVEGIDRKALVSYPIISDSEVCGAVLFLSGDHNEVPSKTHIKLIETAAMFLGKQME